MVMQAISAGAGIIGSLTNKGSAAKAAAEQYKYNLDLQKQAQEWQEYAAKNKWQWETESKEAAGINKLYGLGSATVPSSGVASTGQADYVGEQNNRVQQRLQGIQLGQDFAAKKAEIKLKEQETQTEYYNTQLKALEKIEQNIKNLYQQGELDYQKKRQVAELEEIRSRITKNIADAGRANAEAGTARQKTIQIERINKWHENNPVASGFAIGASESGGGINGTTGGVLGITSEIGTDLGITPSRRDNQKYLNAVKDKIRTYSARGRVMREHK